MLSMTTGNSRKTHRKLEYQTDGNTAAGSSRQCTGMEAIDDHHCVEEVHCVIPFKSALTFSHLTRDQRCQLFHWTSYNAECFLAFYTYLQRKAMQMHYWKGSHLSWSTKNISLRSLTIEQEFLLTLMRLCQCLLIHDYLVVYWQHGP